MPTKKTKIKFFTTILWLVASGLVASNFINSKIGLISGMALVLLAVISTTLTVKLFFSKKYKLVGFVLAILKLPATLGFMYWATLVANFDTLSFLIGMLIVLPCLVILSYRKV